MSKTEELIRAYEHCTGNREQLRTPQRCGCFYCLAIFESTELHRWLENEDTALCPRCMVDSVIGESSGFPITSDFLQKMHDRWF